MKWPNSAYVPLGNNSNTFIRHIVSKVFGRFDEMNGGHIGHPGNRSPQPVDPSLSKDPPEKVGNLVESGIAFSSSSGRS
jgi:hypothetical protein